MGVLDNLEPRSVFHYFEELTKIPHGSGNIRAISDHLTEFAKSRGYETVQDAACNVLVMLPATPGREGLEPLMLQGHMDMVTVKDADADIDLTRDPLCLEVDGDLLRAVKTSLGGDDGIAIAYFCALMDDRAIEHPPLYLLMTTDEETGMDGARALDPSLLKAKYFVNIDSEEEGVLLAGCAGGGRVHLKLPLAQERVAGKRMCVHVTGLRGGHSGTEIVRERGNANLIAGRLLQTLVDEGCRFAVYALSGGAADNAIPADAVLGLLLPTDDPENRNKISNVIKKAGEVIGAELGSKDPGFALEIEEDGGDMRVCLTASAAASAAALLMILPGGVQAMSADMPGLVETSLNLGVMRLEHSDAGAAGEAAILQLDLAVRSSRESARDALIRKLSLIAARFGAEASTHGLYPGWVYDPDSLICRHFAEAYRRQTGKEARVEAIHAGVECGLFREKRPDLDCISIGPDLEHVHSTAERLHIASAGRIWEYLLAALRSWNVERQK